ncbi:hypothetical protein F511_22091 [Dorcoceras hygrometricum]|uniref:CCHC-type domain-containing protein n=1 Tax=Dorcoceras hygrometricum TaxID=472368 RepID=A0A2Z7BWG1_9LAMI|nr:hypothetical protein F511_22091 [Dorcoceras hygrometricum]
MLGTGRSFHCKEPGHISRDCPKRRQDTGRVFVMQAEAADPDTTLLIGEIHVCGVTTLALLDSGATHSFISSAFTQRMGIIPESMGVALAVKVPSGEELTMTSVVQGLTMMFQDHVAPSSDQFHEEIGTSTVGGCRPPNPVHDWILDSFIDASLKLGQPYPHFDGPID